MGKTVAEKILSHASGKDSHAGDVTWAVPDLVYVHDALGPLVLQSFRKMGASRIRFPGRIIFINDHIFPAKDVESAENSLDMKRFAEEHKVKFIGNGEGIEHTLLIENGDISPGMFVVGSDSHTVTAGAVTAMGVGLGSTDIAALLALGKNWFRVPESIRFDLRGKMGHFVTGKDIILEIIHRIGVDGANYMSMELALEDSGISIDDRLAIANMTVEAGAKDGVVFNANDANEKWYLPDSDATYTYRQEIDLSSLRPKVAFPYSPGNVHDVSDAKGVKVNQVYLGNCANGTYRDLEEAAEILRGKTISRNVRMIVVPATRSIYRKALRSGLIEVFLDSGATVAPSTCGACAGLHMGVLGNGEVAVANTNRNFRGRMGHPGSKVYLANSYVAALAALEGEICDPMEVL
ncbi:3-isopropylmalate dehydratase large subunit [Thermoplasmatales archaeon AK]|nr:3-isopropylmalate dehydratase large subunit [Thermoplasmatales archaeon AK]